MLRAGMTVVAGEAGLVRPIYDHDMKRRAATVFLLHRLGRFP
jgi:hypothetical protein